MESNHENEIILYQPDDTLTLDERVEDESVWLTQAQMAELFQATKQNISWMTNGPDRYIHQAFFESKLTENRIFSH